MIRVQHITVLGRHRTQHFHTSSEAGIYLEKLNRPAVMMDEKDELLGACYELPKHQRTGKARWVWWYDPTRVSHPTSTV